ncbi:MULTISPECIES: DUF397 domain-containing protein [Saccharothrix]|uniref:DUF397 domain-containing protein n=1 Tax=Saccharothrix TaxID=2071 RepID=UPI001F5175B6|nr:DUF397 domain-containing protein [Saccharothrix sp. CB00851]
MTTSVRWVKSSYSMENGSCVEVAVGDTVIGVRDSKNAEGPVLTFPADRWVAFLATA